MKQHVHGFGLMILAVTTITVLAVAPAYARSSDETSSNNGSSSKSTAEQSKGQDAAAHNEVETRKTNDESTSHDTTDDTTLQNKAQEMLQEKRKDVSTKTLTERKKICENKQSDIDARFSTVSSVAVRHLQRFNATFDKLVAYQTKKQLSVVQYDSLVAVAKSKQSAATNAVSALNSMSSPIDCTTNDPAQALAIHKSTVATARAALQDYRQSLKDLVQALLASIKEVR